MKSLPYGSSFALEDSFCPKCTIFSKGIGIIFQAKIKFNKEFVIFEFLKIIDMTLQRQRW